MLEPSRPPADLARELNEALRRRALILVLGRCRVAYEGRSASRLGEGDRLVVVKPDGAVLVHRPTGYSPVNWQPDSKVVAFAPSGDSLVLRSVRERPREVLEVVFTRVDAALVAEGMEDPAELVMYLDERELRDYLARHPELIEPGLRVVSVERPVGPGVVDILAVDSRGRTVVVEVKRATAGREAVLQLARYVEALRRLNPGAPVRGVLAAPGITRQALELLNSLGLEFRRVSVERVYEELRRRGGGARGPGLLGFLSGGGASGSSRGGSG